MKEPNSFGDGTSTSLARPAHTELRRRTLARALIVVFVLNLIVMSAGAWHAYEAAPPIPAVIVEALLVVGSGVIGVSQHY